MRLCTYFRPITILLFGVFILSAVVQGQSNIDWSKDTISKNDATGGRDSYNMTAKKSGLKQTSKVTLPVDKLKNIIDACNAKGITEISVLITTIRSVDVARYKRNHPEVASLPDDSLKWRQLLVLQIPRYAFDTNKSSSIKVGNATSLLSLLSMGLILIDRPVGLPFTDGALYFDLGTICPPPAACD